MSALRHYLFSHRALFALALPLALSVTACTGGYEDDTHLFDEQDVDGDVDELSYEELASREGDGHFHGDVDDDEPYYDELSDGLGTVRQQRRRCTTRGVLSLSRQIAEEINCIAPGSLVPFSESSGLEFTGAVMPYLDSEAVTNLRDAARSRTIRVNSAYRSVVQQHMIFAWRQQRRCGIYAAARPGRSPHESGRALDVQNYGSLITTMKNRGWHRTLYRIDPVHFEHTESASLGELGILAFQRLWNRNNPNDRIDEDGDWGPATLARIDRSPAEGFRIGASCR